MWITKEKLNKIIWKAVNEGINDHQRWRHRVFSDRALQDDVVMKNELDVVLTLLLQHLNLEVNKVYAGITLKLKEKKNARFK